MNTEILYSIALTLLPHMDIVNTKNVYEAAGSATAIFENRKNIKDIIPDASNRLIESLSHFDEALKRAEAEIEFITKKHIKAFTLNDPEYPFRLHDCEDAPVVLFFYGDTDLNAKKIISIVGTRRCTQYGKDICMDFITDLKKDYPELLIVSGLAYGIDINAHRAALANGMPTIGVLAHGLDRIYPSLHRQTATKMIENGGLVSEYISGTTPEKINFIRRNRIIAGLSDATIVVESANHGGALITADIAQTYNRDVFAFPGRIKDEFSEGCNNLIINQKATMIQSADSFLQAMNWQTSKSKHCKDTQKELFPSLSDDEQKIVDSLKGCDSKQVNQIVIETGMKYATISSILYELEIKGIVRLLGGARYKLVL